MVTNEGPSDGAPRENFNFILTSHQGVAELETYSSKKSGKIDSMLQSLFFLLKSSGQIPYNSEIYIPYEDKNNSGPTIKQCGLQTETWSVDNWRK
jgi:hypothetical protein